MQIFFFSMTPMSVFDIINHTKTQFITQLTHRNVKSHWQIRTASSDGSFLSTGACNLEVPGSNPGQIWCLILSSWLGIYSAPNCSKAWVHSVSYGIVHYKEPLKPFEIDYGTVQLPVSFCRDNTMIVQKAT